jgi:hypothetical protein
MRRIGATRKTPAFIGLDNRNRSTYSAEHREKWLVLVKDRSRP